MRKVPPVPVPTGQHFCFVCEQLHPVADFYKRKGKAFSPCKPCTKKAPERAARFVKMWEDSQAERAAFLASRPPAPPSIVPVYAPMDGLARYLAQMAKRRDLPKCGPVPATPSESPRWP